MKSRGGSGPLVQTECSGTLARKNDQILIVAAAGTQAHSALTTGDGAMGSLLRRMYKDILVVAEKKDTWNVRWLTPIECERLQGFPDNWTLTTNASNTARYKALGNSMAVPVIRWIGKRLKEIDKNNAM